MNSTTTREDAVCSECQGFGGKAAECADIVERLDRIIDADKDKFSVLENRIGELENKIEELEAELKEAREVEAYE
jgi:hypothetical protein